MVDNDNRVNSTQPPDGTREGIEQWMRHPERGATAIEYGLIAALIAVAAIAAMQVLGQQKSQVCTTATRDAVTLAIDTGTPYTGSCDKGGKHIYIAITQ